MEAVEGATAAANAPYPASSSSSGVRHQDTPNQTDEAGRMATC